MSDLVVVRFDNDLFGRRNRSMLLEEFVHLPQRERRRALRRFKGIDLLPPIAGGAAGGSVYTVPTTAAALSASTTKSLAQIAPGAHTCAVSELYVGFDGSSAQQSITVDIWRSDGTSAGTSTSKTPVKENETDGAADASGAVNFTVEPTVLSLIKSWFVPPSSSLLIQAPLGREFAGKSSGLKIGLRVTTPSGVTPNALSYLEFVE